MTCASTSYFAFLHNNNTRYETPWEMMGSRVDVFGIFMKKEAFIYGIGTELY